MTGPPKFFDASLHTCHVLRPRQALQELACSAPFVLASVSLNTSPPALNHPNGAECTSGSAGSPTAYMFPCVRFVCFVRCYPLPCLADSAPPPEKPPTVLYASGMDAQTEIRIIISSTDAGSRYGRLAKPYPAGTFTRQEAPSLLLAHKGGVPLWKCRWIKMFFPQICQKDICE